VTQTPTLTISRRGLGIGAAAATLAACTGEAGPPPESTGVDRVRMLTGLGTFQGREAYLYVAQAKGFFAEERLEVEILPGEGTEANLTLLAGGQTDIATIDVNAGMVAFSTGEFTDFVLTAVLHTGMLGCVMVLADSDFQRPRDLAGTTIAVIPGGTNTVLFPAFAQLAGFDPDSVEFVSPPPESFGALLGAGEVDAVQQFVVGKPNLEQGAGEPVRVFPYAEWLPELYGSAIGCSRGLAEANPELVRRFNRAALKGLEYAVANPDEAGAVFAEGRAEVQPAEVAAAENRLLEPYVRLVDDLNRGEFSPSRLVQTAGLLESLGVIDSSVDPADIVALDLDT
jgi:NitT/TauT family transport system substrate-binding protein